MRSVLGTQESVLDGLTMETACALVSTVPDTNVFESTVLITRTSTTLDSTGRLAGTDQINVREEKRTLEVIVLSSVPPVES